MVDAQGQGQSTADAAALQEAKALLREAVLLRRETRTAAERTQQDLARFAQLQKALEPSLGGLQTVSVYLSTGAEPSTLQLIGWLAAHDITVLLPVLSGGPDGIRKSQPDWAPYGGPDRLRIGPHSILEPTTAPLGPQALARADLVIASALAASAEGDRLGRGGGWYDRALEHASQAAETWVLLNDEEVLKIIPTQAWDRRVDVLVTPSRLIRTSPHAA
ncbi:5-formyltetrahydrofolate cyclo-ligase [Microlunatus panaciterrae]|uniref:5-formyltetrahydrofolate cyclo-ligase n=1 Tax=Microlunatus panaciterrae TaxID=400768 RepID=A0ABS2RGM6_9ACTN|nr:5-formyltetrahydrofolate cyclo-ligase [Microlunatus panaciterrae]MBM7798122.1 5-formyltetrahydrofolate cyclo-ligase [Microlunatus panaciterrae]